MQDNNKVSSSATEKDINDVFSDILLSEEKISEEAYKQGYQIGASQENLEAYHLGYHRGAELGAEIGYYAGFTESYLEYFTQRENSEKYIKTLQTLKKLIDEFPKHNTDNILELADNIRTTYKKVCAQLKVHAPFPESSKLSF